MKNVFKLMAALTLSVSAFAQTQRPMQNGSANIKKLDVLQTCNTAKQKATAEAAASFLFNYRWWHISNLYNAIHPDYQSWHASRVFQASITPSEKWDQLPYKKGIVSKANFLEDLAMIAYTNHVPSYKIDLNRAECMGDDTVVLSSIFNGVTVLRNAQGYITHAVPLPNLPTRFTFVMKNQLVYRLIIDLDDRATVEIFKKVREVATTQPPMPPNESTRTTYQDILKKFKQEAGVR